MPDVKKQDASRRLKDGWECVDCGTETSVVNDVGEPQCQRCQRALRLATARAVATCACGSPMLSEAVRCGFCAAEAEATGVGR